MLGNSPTFSLLPAHINGLIGMQLHVVERPVGWQAMINILKLGRDAGVLGWRGVIIGSGWLKVMSMMYYRVVNAAQCPGVQYSGWARSVKRGCRRIAGFGIAIVLHIILLACFGIMMGTII